MVAYYVTCIRKSPKTRISIGPFLNQKAAEEAAERLRLAKLVDFSEVEEDKYPQDS